MKEIADLKFMIQEIEMERFLCQNVFFILTRSSMIRHEHKYKYILAPLKIDFLSIQTVDYYVRPISWSGDRRPIGTGPDEPDWFGKTLTFDQCGLFFSF